MTSYYSGVAGLWCLDWRGRLQHIQASSARTVVGGGKLYATLDEKSRSVCYGVPTQTYPSYLDASQTVLSIGCCNDAILWVTEDGNVNIERGLMKRPVNLLPLFPEGVTFRSIACGHSHVLAIASDGVVWGWGANQKGQLGQGHTVPVEEPVRMNIPNPAVAAAAGLGHNCVITSSGELFTWGWSIHGQTGQGEQDVTAPTQLPLIGPTSDDESKTELLRVAQIACGDAHCLALCSNGRVYAWGSNREGQLGQGEDGLVREYLSSLSKGAAEFSEFSVQPLEVMFFRRHTVEQVVAGGDLSAVRTAIGRIYVWGKHAQSMSQRGNASSMPSIVRPLMEAVVSSLAVSGDCVLAITDVKPRLVVAEETMIHDLEVLRPTRVQDCPPFADCTLVGKDGRLNAHRVVMLPRMVAERTEFLRTYRDRLAYRLARLQDRIPELMRRVEELSTALSQLSEATDADLRGILSFSQSVVLLNPTRWESISSYRAVEILNTVTRVRALIAETGTDVPAQAVLWYVRDRHSRDAEQMAQTIVASALDGTLQWKEPVDTQVTDAFERLNFRWNESIDMPSEERLRAATACCERISTLCNGTDDTSARFATHAVVQTIRHGLRLDQDLSTLCSTFSRGIHPSEEQDWSTARFTELVQDFTERSGKLRTMLNDVDRILDESRRELSAVFIAPLAEDEKSPEAGDNNDGSAPAASAPLDLSIRLPCTVEVLELMCHYGYRCRLPDDISRPMRAALLQGAIAFGMISLVEYLQALEATESQSEAARAAVKPSIPKFNLGSAMSNEELRGCADVTVQGSDASIKLHAPVLYARCPALRPLLLRDDAAFADSGTCVLHMSEFSLAAVTNFAEFLYQEDVVVSPNVLVEVLVLADMYCMTRLKQMCEEQLDSYIDATNVVDLFFTAQQLNAKGLQMLCKHYCFTHLEDVARIRAYQALPVGHPLKPQAGGAETGSGCTIQ